MFFLINLLITFPAVLGLISFQARPPPMPLIFVAIEGEDSSRELVVVGATVPSGFPFSPQQHFVEGRITNNCSISHPPETDIILVNLTDPHCQKHNALIPASYLYGFQKSQFDFPNSFYCFPWSSL